MPRFHVFIALNVGGGVGWWAGAYVGIWTALFGSAVGSLLCIWLVWRFREYLGG
ncbi:MAG: hypothetical protein ACFUZC_16045 [Chthoniobacteraceae bacterium]